MIYNRIILIQKLDKNGKWQAYHSCHAAVNKIRGGEELEAGAFQSQEALQIDVRYCEAVKAIRHDLPRYQVQYRGETYKITDYDDYFERHRNIRLRGVHYG